MVLTRSRAASPASGAGNPSVDVTPPPPASGAALAQHPLRDSCEDAGAAQHASGLDAPELPPSAAAAAAAAATPVVMTTDQLLLLINRISRCDPASNVLETERSSFFGFTHEIHISTSTMELVQALTAAVMEVAEGDRPVRRYYQRYDTPFVGEGRKSNT